MVVPEGVEHPDADAVVEFAAAMGVVLDPWQELVLRAMLLRGRGLFAGYWAALTLGLCVGRQNGKNGLVEVRELAGPVLLGEELVMHTAHLADTAKESFRRLDQLLEANEWLSKDVRHVRRQNGHEAIEFRNGNRIRFRTRTKSAGRGWSGDLVVFDESMYLAQEGHTSAFPVISARPDPQVLYLGSAVDRLVHDDGIVFSNVRSDALAGHPRAAWLEWSVEADGPDDLTAAQLSDPECWAVANPALGIRISLDYLPIELRKLLPRGFAVERLSVGDWFPPEGVEDQPLIQVERWNELAVVAESSPIAGPVVLAYDIAPDRSMAAVAIAGVNADGLAQVEITDHRRGTGWLVERVLELMERHEPDSARCDAYALLPALEQAGVVPLNGPELGRACVRLVDAVNAGTFRHLGSDELRNAVRVARTRPIGDAAFAWSRRGSTTDITPLVAASIAVDAALQLPEDAGEMVIY